MARCFVAVVISILGAASGMSCNPAKDSEPATTENPTSQAADWKGREVLPAQPPPGWAVWDSGDGIRIATPVELRQQPIPGTQILRAEHDGVRYQISNDTDSPHVTGTIHPAELFEAFLDSFAESGGFRRDGLTEPLRVSGYPAAQARFTDGKQRGVIRVVRLGNKTVSLTILSAGVVEEGNPMVGGFLNSLLVEKRAK